jgi:lipoate-protein ligase A
VNARYRPRNDIEVEGRKISGTGGFFDEDTLFYQGTVLVDMNPADMVAALNVPEAKLAKRALDSAAQRVVTLKELLGAAPGIATIQKALLEGFAGRLGIAPVEGTITEEEEALAAKYHDEEIGTESFVAEIDDPGADKGVLAASHTSAGGTVTAYVRLEGARSERIREVLITGDFFVTPPRTVLDLEASLRNVPVTDVAGSIDRFFSGTKVGLLSISPADFRAAIEAAIASG